MRKGKDMTKEEIIKALEFCTEYANCKRCPTESNGNCDIDKYALDLIRKQEAEIERILKITDQLQKVVKVETVRKMQEILNATPLWFVSKDTIDQIAKEMLEGEK